MIPNEIPTELLQHPLRRLEFHSALWPSPPQTTLWSAEGKGAQRSPWG